MEMSNKKIKVAVDTTENVSDEDFLKIHEELHRLARECPTKVIPAQGNMGEGKAEVVKAIARAEEEIEFIKNLPDLLEQDKRSDRFFGMRLKGKSIDDIENKFLAMFAEFVSLMALFIGMLGFGILIWAIFGG
jgi:hypothetical protein